ncbi:MAG: DUF2461 domain-containing protein [Bacteroidia bacterium]|nr:DUF2461 domain-containing protein [Bacteroidia bacterium]
MLSPDTLPFLLELKAHNHKEWFEANRARYQAVRTQLVRTVDAIIEGVSAFDPSVSGLDASKSLFRINRDVRFSKDKSPYKVNMGAYLSGGGKNTVYAGYYLHLEPGGCFVGGGSYQPQPPELKKIRAHIDYNSQALREILADPGFQETFGVLQGEQLRTVPREYPKDHPDADLLKFKGFFVTANIPEEMILTSAFTAHVVRCFQTMHPLNVYLNEALGADEA